MSSVSQWKVVCEQATDTSSGPLRPHGFLIKILPASGMPQTCWDSQRSLRVLPEKALVGFQGRGCVSRIPCGILAIQPRLWSAASRRSPWRRRGTIPLAWLWSRPLPLCCSSSARSHRPPLPMPRRRWRSVRSMALRTIWRGPRSVYVPPPAWRVSGKPRANARRRTTG